GDEAAYSSVVIGEGDGVRQYVQFLARGLVGVEAKSGKFLWRYKRTIDVGANIPTPVVHDGQVFSSTGRNAGAVIKLSGADTDPPEVWLSKTIRNGLGGVVLVGNQLFGTNELELLCFDFTTGKINWKDKSVGGGAVCCADGHIYLRGATGGVALV